MKKYLTISSPILLSYIIGCQGLNQSSRINPGIYNDQEWSPTTFPMPISNVKEMTSFEICKPFIDRYFSVQIEKRTGSTRPNTFRKIKNNRVVSPSIDIYSALEKIKEDIRYSDLGLPKSLIDHTLAVLYGPLVGKYIISKYVNKLSLTDSLTRYALERDIKDLVELSVIKNNSYVPKYKPDKRDVCPIDYPLYAAMWHSPNALNVFDPSFLAWGGVSKYFIFNGNERVNLLTIALMASHTNRNESTRVELKEQTVRSILEGGFDSTIFSSTIDYLMEPNRVEQSLPTVPESIKWLEREEALDCLIKVLKSYQPLFYYDAKIQLLHRLKCSIRHGHLKLFNALLKPVIRNKDNESLIKLLSPAQEKGNQNIICALKEAIAVVKK